MQVKHGMRGTAPAVGKMHRECEADIYGLINAYSGSYQPGYKELIGEHNITSRCGNNWSDTNIAEESNPALDGTAGCNQH